MSVDVRAPASLEWTCRVRLTTDEWIYFRTPSDGRDFLRGVMSAGARGAFLPTFRLEGIDAYGQPTGVELGSVSLARAEFVEGWGP